MRLTVCPWSREPQGRALSDSLPGVRSGQHQRLCAEQQQWELAQGGGIAGLVGTELGLRAVVVGLIDAKAAGEGWEPPSLTAPSPFPSLLRH
jgi:hypothetical protein